MKNHLNFTPPRNNTIASFFLIYFLIIFISCQKEVKQPNTSQSKLKFLIGTNYDKINGVKPTNDGGFIYCGYTISDSLKTKSFLLKVDADGNREWYHTYGSNKYTELNSAIKCSDGGYLGVGKTTLFGGTGVTINSDMDYVVKTDANGNEQWSKSITTGQFALCELFDVIESPDHFCYATGFYPSATVRMDVFLVKFDLNGDMKFEKNIPALTSYKPYLIKDVDWAGGMAITINEKGELLIPVGYVEQSGKRFNALLNASSSGSINFYYPYFNHKMESNYRNSTGKRIKYRVSAANDGYYLAWSADSVTNTGIKECIFLKKTDLDGNQIWSKGYLDNGHTFLENMTLGGDGNIYLCGGFSNSVLGSNYAEGFNSIMATIIKIAPAGELIYKSNLGSLNNVCILKAVQPLTDGSLYVAGVVLNNQNGSTKMFCTKLSSNGEYQNEN